MMGYGKPIVAANWKMFKTLEESAVYVEEFKIKILKIERVDIILCVSFTSLFHISSLLESGDVQLGAQNMHWREEGAFTGEISPGMLRSSGADWVILGHSERRHILGETDDEIAKKVRSAIDEGLNQILCIGETLHQRERGETVGILARQLDSVMESVGKSDPRKVVIAYEPVWAIGTGVNATPDQVEDAHGEIRNLLTNSVPSVASSMRVLYGGSVKAGNAHELISAEGVDGFLVGGASLDVDTFVDIIQVVEEHELSKN